MVKCSLSQAQVLKKAEHEQSITPMTLQKADSSKYCVTTVLMPQGKVNISNMIVGSSQVDIAFLVVAAGVNELKDDCFKNEQSSGHVSSGLYTRCETANC